jgi:DNA-binding CsgD family transcriptional regulator
MDKPMYTEASKIWKPLHRGIQDQKLEFDLQQHKQWLDLFHVGKYYYFIFNIKEGKFDFMSPEATEVMGYNYAEYTVAFLLGKIHPDDQPYFLNYENHVVKFFSELKPEQIPNYKVSYDYRLQKHDGTYIRVLQQVITINFDEQGRLLRTLGIHTDITYLKPLGKPTLSFIGMNGEPSYYNVNVNELFKTTGIQFTKREREILNLMLHGCSSKEISNRLFIAKQTVDTHRKNMLQKTGCHNTAGLVSAAVQEGWI